MLEINRNGLLFLFKLNVKDIFRYNDFFLKVNFFAIVIVRVWVCGYVSL